MTEPTAPATVLDQPGTAPGNSLGVRAWIRDGHMAAVVLDEDVLAIRLECPCPKDADYSGVAWDDLPACRKNYDEGGQPAPDESPLSFCNFAEWADNMGVLDCVDTDVTRGEEMTIVGSFPVGWRWEPGDEMYVWAPSTLIDKRARQHAPAPYTWEFCRSCGGGGWVGARIDHKHPGCGHRCILCDPPPGYDRTYAVTSLPDGAGDPR